MSLETTFFSGNARREIFVADYRPLGIGGGAQLKKLLLRMPIGQEQSLLGVPDWIGAAFDSVAKDANHQGRINLEPELKGMTLEVFATSEGEHCALLLTRCTLKGFHMVRVGKQEKARFFLIFTVYTPNSLELHSWLNEHYGMSSFVKFYVDQSSLLDDEADADDPAEEDDESAEGEDAEDEDEDYEAARQEALSAAHYDEFPDAARTTPLVGLNGGRKGRASA